MFTRTVSLRMIQNNANKFDKKKVWVAMGINISQCKNNRCLYQGILHLWSKFGYFSVNFLVQSDLEGEGWSPLKTTGILTNVCFPPVAQIWWLYRERVMSYRTDKFVIDRQTQTEAQATTIPKGQNWPLVKAGLCTCFYSFPSKKNKVYKCSHMIYG